MTDDRHSMCIPKVTGNGLPISRQLQVQCYLVPCLTY